MTDPSIVRECYLLAERHHLSRDSSGMARCDACGWLPNWGDDLRVAAGLHQTQVIIERYEELSDRHDPTDGRGGVR